MPMTVDENDLLKCVSDEAQRAGAVRSAVANSSRSMGSGVVVTTKMTAIEVTLLVTLRKLRAGVELTRGEKDIKK
jgi:hypothetical protein